MVYSQQGLGCFLVKSTNMLDQNWSKLCKNLGQSRCNALHYAEVVDRQASVVGEPLR